MQLEGKWDEHNTYESYEIILHETVAIILKAKKQSKIEKVKKDENIKLCKKRNQKKSVKAVLSFASYLRLKKRRVDSSECDCVNKRLRLEN